MRQLLGKCLPFLFLIVLVVILSLATEHFATPGNVSNILRFSSVIIIMGVGMTFVIISGGIDLSIGSVLAFCSILVAWCMTAGWPMWLSLLVGILTGTAWGVVNGLMVVFLRLPPFVATLASMGLARGSATILAKKISGYGTSIEITTKGFAFLGSGTILKIPWPGDPEGFPFTTPILVMLAVIVVGHYILNHMRVGRYAFAIGSNEEAARYSGIPVGRYKIAMYVLLGTLAGLAGMIEASINRGGHSTLGEMYELNVIAAVVIGGGSLSGGQGTVIGTLTGALIMGVIRNGCIHLRFDYEWQLVIISVLIVIAVGFDTYQRRRTGA
jgi:ribose transport system permease protein